VSYLRARRRLRAATIKATPNSRSEAGSVVDFAAAAQIPTANPRIVRPIVIARSPRTARESNSGARTPGWVALPILFTQRHLGDAPSRPVISAADLSPAKDRYRRRFAVDGVLCLPEECRRSDTDRKDRDYPRALRSTTRRSAGLPLRSCAQRSPTSLNRAGAVRTVKSRGSTPFSTSFHVSGVETPA